MKHQIVLVGGQLLPVYLGIKEFEPHKVHFIFSKESQNGVAVIKRIIKSIQYTDNIVDAFDFNSVKAVCDSLIGKLSSADEVSFNLTSGTKIMVLAIQAFVLENPNFSAFYINQNNSILSIPNYQKSPINYQLTAEEFFKLSGHVISSSKKITDYSQAEFKASKEIEIFAKTPTYRKVTEFIRTKYRNHEIPLIGDENVNSSLKCLWTASKIEIYLNGGLAASFVSKNIVNLLFNAGWWELIVAQEISKAISPKELLLNVVLPFINDNTSSKNEIDILINNHNKLIFVECKSGTVKNDDINKIRVIKQTYGGLVSKSILVTLHPPTANITEKCKELDIEIFISKFMKFERLISLLNKLGKTGSL